MPEEIIFDENIKGKVQVESLSELEDYVEHENVKRNATITKITRTIGKVIVLFTLGPIFLCLLISMIIEVVSTIQGTNEGGLTTPRGKPAGVPMIAFYQHPYTTRALG